MEMIMLKYDGILDNGYQLKKLNSSLTHNENFYIDTCLTTEFSQKGLSSSFITEESKTNQLEKCKFYILLFLNRYKEYQ
jgi:hypothetical protein